VNLFRTVKLCVCFLFLAKSGLLVHAQEIRVKLVNGRTGAPIARSHVNVWVGNKRKAAVAIPANENGVATLRLTNKPDEVQVCGNSNACGESGVINPVVEYDDLLKINVPYVLCEPHGTDYSWLALKTFSTQQVVQHGVVTSNTCGKETATPPPGELIIFVRPLNWREKLKE
jgi:hypothetical protein